MDRSIIIGCLVFLLTFLLWPTTHYPVLATCSEGPSLNNDITADCSPQQTPETVGGGIRYLRVVIKKGGYTGPENTPDYYFVGETSMFHPQHALWGAVVVGSVTGIIVALLGKRKVSKIKNKLP